MMPGKTFHTLLTSIIVPNLCQTILIIYDDTVQETVGNTLELVGIGKYIPNRIQVEK
jgi:hypothetical protein